MILVKAEVLPSKINSLQAFFSTHNAIMFLGVLVTIDDYYLIVRWIVFAVRHRHHLLFGLLAKLAADIGPRTDYA
jgi:hypothetical protein